MLLKQMEERKYMFKSNLSSASRLCPLTSSQRRRRGIPKKSRGSWNLIKAIADELPITRLLRFFVEDIANNNEDTGGKRLNNARVRRFGQRIWDKANAYQVIKYRDKYKTIIRHCRLKPEKSKGEDKVELQNWLFGKLTKANQVVKCHLLRRG